MYQIFGYQSAFWYFILLSFAIFHLCIQAIEAAESAAEILEVNTDTAKYRILGMEAEYGICITVATITAGFYSVIFNLVYQGDSSLGEDFQFLGLKRSYYRLQVVLVRVLVLAIATFVGRPEGKTLKRSCAQ